MTLHTLHFRCQTKELPPLLKVKGVKGQNTFLTPFPPKMAMEKPKGGITLHTLHFWRQMTPMKAHHKPMQKE
jgi:hypothetical protein